MATKNVMLLHGQTVTKEAMARFKKAYLEALEKGETQYTFDGQEVLVSYAKYVVEYAERELGPL